MAKECAQCGKKERFFAPEYKWIKDEDYLCESCYSNWLVIKKEFLEKYNFIIKNANISENHKKILLKNMTDQTQYLFLNNSMKVFVWKNNENLCIFPSNPIETYSTTTEMVETVKIPINQIEYFSKSGQVFRDTIISGGGGGGSTIGGAIVGGVVAGGVGAIIGSRGKMKAIKSEVVIHDTRETLLNYFDEKNERQTIFFGEEAYQVLKDIIPEKEYDFVNLLNSEEMIRKHSSQKDNMSITVQIRELKKLQMEGIITEQEFTEKKQILLDKIH